MNHAVPRCALAVFLATGTSIQGDPMLWSDRTPGPAPRAGSAMVFDGGRGVAVLFGGALYLPTSLPLGETWEWNGTQWVQAATAGPSPRSGHAMVYDGVRGVTILFGGNDLNYDGETWEWDGTSWTMRATSGPSPRESHAMAYDDARGVVVLFGGAPAPLTYNDETWEYDTQTSHWTQRFPATHPSGRFDHAMAYDAVRARTVLFGGRDSEGYDGETWEWDGTEWSFKANTGPRPRAQSALTLDSYRNRIVLFGGDDGQYRNDIWEWDGTIWKYRSSGGPSPRWDHAMAYDSVRGVTMVVAGCDTDLGQGGTLDQTWAWDGNIGQWIQLSSTGPRPRYKHRLVYDSMRCVTVLYSGDWGFGLADSRTWEWDGQSWMERTQPTDLGYRVDYSFAYDARRGVTVLFGGTFGSAPDAQSDTWEWDGAHWIQRMVNGPGGRAGHGTVYDIQSGQLVLFGGQLTDYEVMNDTWVWDGEGDWQELFPATSPSPRFGQAMAYDSGRDRTVLFGGQNLTTVFTATWGWDGATWQKVADRGPPGASFAAMDYDSDRGVTVLYGASNESCWEWDGTEWTEHTGAPTLYRPYSTMVYDSARRAMVLFGGGGPFPSCIFGDTWEYLPDCNGNQVPDIDDIEHGTSADCQSNAIPDECDLAAGTNTDCNGDLIPDSCQAVCLGDANRDCLIDPLDSGYVQARLGCVVGTGDPECDAADVNLDGVVDPLDVGFVLSRFGDCP